MNSKLVYPFIRVAGWAHFILSKMLIARPKILPRLFLEIYLVLENFKNNNKKTFSMVGFLEVTKAKYKSCFAFES